MFRRGEGIITLGMFPQGCEGAVVHSRLLSKGGAGSAAHKQGGRLVQHINNTVFQALLHIPSSKFVPAAAKLK
jgi:hypothetical protein